jgi:hypothetical protein
MHTFLVILYTDATGQIFTKLGVNHSLGFDSKLYLMTLPTDQHGCYINRA